MYVLESKITISNWNDNFVLKHIITISGWDAHFVSERIMIPFSATLS